MEQETNTASATTGLHVTIGNIVALLMLAFALIAGGWYLMGGLNDSPAVTDSAAPNTAIAPDQATVALTHQGASDEVAAIDADLKSTDLTSLDDVSKL